MWEYLIGAYIIARILLRVKSYLTRKSVAGDVVLITGAASGIGKQMARRFSKLGSTVVIWDIDQEGLKKTTEEIKTETNGKVFEYKLNLLNREEVYATAEKVKAEVGKVDILINNAGIVSGKSILSDDFDDQKAADVIALNTTAHIWTVRAFVKDMVKTNKGHIVSIASAAGITGCAGLTDYCASKFGAVGFNEALRLEFRKKKLTGCHTTVICPFYINTGMFKGVKTKSKLLLPILEESYVADAIVDGVRENREFIGLPATIHYLSHLMSALFPPHVKDTILEILGISDTMDDFVGRAKKE